MTTPTLHSHELFVGMLVSWIHTPRGGYGYSYPVDATIVALSLDGTCADIEVKTRHGKTVKRRVSYASLRRRDAALSAALNATTAERRAR